MKTLTNLAFFLVILFATSSGLSGQISDVVGSWVTIDDDEVTKKSRVEIFEKDGAIFGKVMELYNPSEPDPKCTNCDDDRRDQPIVGMEVIRDMKPKGDGRTFANGTIVDPENGKVYKCTMWREGNELKVRGWIGFLYRTQSWELAE